ncbi:helix-turn-helix domain-containing protein [Streptomyces sp. WMMC500]|uniref:winged helix-turn-helix transcriptional regulator n=1 Tax=Streptomyces sp. WMMC500 TaxID=3015154 RepID=UPI00248C5A4D|nr:helix-turn-helix domain-containing protein [Streptomyces sp. WMMC500]WBB58667.1 helix-turn-helix domain-containing protein [Streptomyces sp. WMMC500]
MTTLNRPGAPDGHVCGIDAAMEIIGGKWKVLILWALDDRQDRRFGELRRLLPGITEKVLASHLREMEADGIVRRTAYEEVPPRVEYSLTDSGTRLNAALGPLAAWGRERVAGAGAVGAGAVGAGAVGAGTAGAGAAGVPAAHGGAERARWTHGRTPG